MKKTIIITLLVLIILFVPFVRRTVDDGGTVVYDSLTYKIVVWNPLTADENGNRVDSKETKIYFFPDNMKSLDELKGKK